MGAGRSEPVLTKEEQERLNMGKPVILPGGIRITKNQETGLLEGVPKEWIKFSRNAYKVDEKKLVSTKDFHEAVRAESDLPESIINMINAKPVKFSLPKGTHQYEVQMEKLSPSKKEGGYAQLNYSISQNQPDTEYESAQNLTESSLFQSSVQAELLTTSEFENMIKNVYFNRDNPSSKFVFEKELGKGAMCKVYFAYDKEMEGRKYYACRIIKLRDQRTLNKIRTEIAVMNLCSSGNLTEHYFTHYYKDCLFMFVEFMDGGALTDLVYQYMKKMPERVIAYILRQICKGLHSLHSRRQLHRDLKSDNVLLGMDGSVKIADFGFAIQLTKEVLNRKSLVGTPAWMAPQLIRKQPYDEAVDIWSLGIVAIQLLDGEPPCLRMKHAHALQHIAVQPPPQLTSGSPDLKDLVSKCLQKDPKDRATAAQLLEHPFFKSIGQGHAQRELLVEMLRKMKKHTLGSIIRDIGGP